VARAQESGRLIGQEFLDLRHQAFDHGAIRELDEIAELIDGIDPFDFLNRLAIVVLSSNLGDNRTLAIPVAHTIFYEMGPERRAAMGITDSLIRISVGIEDRDDLIGDFRQALA